MARLTVEVPGVGRLKPPRPEPRGSPGDRSPGAFGCWCPRRHAGACALLGKRRPSTASD